MSTTGQHLAATGPGSVASGRPSLVRAGVRVEMITVAWIVVEAVVAIGAGPCRGACENRTGPPLLIVAIVRIGRMGIRRLRNEHSLVETERSALRIADQVAGLDYTTQL